MIHYRTCSLCEALCGLEIEVEEGRVQGIRGDEADPLSRGHICPKAVALKDLHEDPDRLRQPVRRVGERWEPVGWDEALDEVAARLHAVQSGHGRDAVGTYSGNPAAHNYALLLAKLGFDEALGSKSRFSATSADQLPHMLAALEMFGHQLLLPIPDLDRTELFVMFGANPAASNGSIMTAPDMPRRLREIRSRGGRTVLFDPRFTETAKLVSEHHFVRPESDALVLAALLNVIFEEGLVDGGAWREYTSGVARLEKAVAPFAPERVVTATGVDADVIRGLAREIASAGSCAVYGRMGVSTQAFGGLCAWFLYALNIVSGNLDRRGGVMFTSPAVDLVAIAAKVGQTGHFGWRQSRVSGLPEFGGEYPVAVLSEEIETEGDGQIRALITIAGNPVLSTPNGARLDRALANLDFMVSLDWYVTETSRHADFILPPASVLERDHFGLAFHALSVRNTLRYCEPVFEAPEGALHDWQVVLRLGRALLAKRGGIKSMGQRAGLKAWEALGPRRVLDLAMRFGPHPGLSLKRLADHPHGLDLGPLQPRLPERLSHGDGRVQLAPDLFVGDLDRLAATLESTATVDGSPSLSLIGRRHLRSNNSWMHNSERLVRGRERCTLMMHSTDASARSLSDGQSVRVRSRTGELTAPLEVVDDIMPGVVSLPHGWGHGRAGVKLEVASKFPGVSANDVTDEKRFDPLTGTAAFSGLPVEVMSGD